MFEVKVKKGTIKAQAANETLTFVRMEKHGDIIVYSDLDLKENWDAYMNRLRELAYHIDNPPPAS